MNKKNLGYIIIPLIIAMLVLSGCTSNDTNPINNDKNIVENKPPIIRVTTNADIDNPPDYVDMSSLDTVVYAGETITFDASGSSDSDGDELSCKWIWYDNSVTEGMQATKTFEIDDIFSLNGLPLIFSVTLVVDDGTYQELYAYYIGVIPKDQVLYFDSNSLKLTKPSSKQNTIRMSLDKLRKTEEIEYKLQNPLTLQKCSWKTTIYLEKPMLPYVQKVTLTLLNETGKEISKTEKTFKILETFWKEKKIEFTGHITSGEEFKSVKIKINGFGLRSKVNVLLGGEKSSNIFFDFTS